MELFKITFRIIFGLTIFLGVYWVINYLFIKGIPFMAIVYFYVNLIQMPILLIFIVIMFYNYLFRKIPLSFFKTELVYVLIQIIVWTALYFSSSTCPTCPQ